MAYEPDATLSPWGGLHSRWSNVLQDLQQERIKLVMARPQDLYEQLDAIDARIREATNNVCADYQAQMQTLYSTAP